MTGSKPDSTCSVTRAARTERQRVWIERGGQPDARRGFQLQRRGDQQAGFSQRIGEGQAGAAAARQPE